MLEVLEAGLLTTVEDAGRPGWGEIGVPRGGAADAWSLGVANQLLGNQPGDAVLEVTFGGLRLRALEPSVVAVAGAELGARLAGAHPVAPGRVIAMQRGEVLAFVGAVPGAGLRACLALPGGIDVPEVMGSRSTCLAGGFGGLDGRSLRPGDRVRGRRQAGAPADALDAVWSAEAAAPRHTETDGAWRLRVIAAGPGLAPGAAGALDRILATRWVVSPASDRMGVRLEHPDADRFAGAPVGRISHGVTPGAIQVPPDGRPIILGVDCQPTGGYPVIAVVITADLPALGQLGSGDAVRLDAVDQAAARRALQAQRAAFSAACRVLAADARWSDLWRSAGA